MSDDKLFQETLALFYQQDKNLSFVDCSLLYLSQNYRIHTFDTSLEKCISEKYLLSLAKVGFLRHKKEKSRCAYFTFYI